MMNNTINNIRKRFPGQDDTIAILMTKNSIFFTICEDYGECIKALNYWNQSKKPEARDRVKEYRDIIQALEAEIDEILL
jgi:hypothetical protein